MPAAARKDGTDSVQTGHECDSITYTDEGSDNVFVISIGAVRMGDLCQQHLWPEADSCVIHTLPLSTASHNVYVNNKGIGRLRDSYSGEVLITGSSNVFVNGD